MTIFLKFDINTAYKKILQEQLDKLQLSYSLINFGEIEINETTLSKDTLKLLHDGLKEYGVEVVERHKSILVQKIKDAITEMIYIDDEPPSLKLSAYLAQKLNHAYGYLTNVFSEVTFTSIENYVILQRTERAKQLITTNEFTFTEIAWKLNYSSVAHFSTQFKNATGITPSAFQRIINKRRAILKQGEQATDKV